MCSHLMPVSSLHATRKLPSCSQCIYDKISKQHEIEGCLSRMRAEHLLLQHWRIWSAFQWGSKWCVQCFALFNPSIACVSWWPRTILACFTSLPMISFMELSRWCHPCSSWQCELVPPHSIYVSCFQKKVIPCLAGLTPNKTAQS